MPSERETLTREVHTAGSNPAGKPIQEWLTPRNGSFLSLMILAAVIFVHPLAVVIGSSVSLDQYSQILVVPPISVALLYLERNTIFARVSYAKLGAVFFAVLVGVFAYISFLARGMEASTYISLSILLFSGCCIAAFWFSYGGAAFQSGMFPLCFLVCMTPLPDALRNRVIAFLQHGSALGTDWFFSVANIPFSRDGVVIALPTVTIEIAQECSGIRSSLILVIAGLVLGHLFLGKTWSKFVLVALLVPLTIAKNALRIFTLSTLGIYVNPSFLTGRLHHQGGIVFFAASFVALWGMVWILQKFEGRAVAAKTVAQSS